jgi:hypothetical protein
MSSDTLPKGAVTSTPAEAEGELTTHPSFPSLDSRYTFLLSFSTALEFLLYLDFHHGKCGVVSVHNGEVRLAQTIEITAKRGSRFGKIRLGVLLFYVQRGNRKQRSL